MGGWFAAQRTPPGGIRIARAELPAEAGGAAAAAPPRGASVPARQGPAVSSAKYCATSNPVGSTS